MTNEQLSPTPSPQGLLNAGVSRRSVLTAGAWSVPIIAVAVHSPAASASHGFPHGPSLGTACDFAVLAGDYATDTATGSTIDGSVGSGIGAYTGLEGEDVPEQTDINTALTDFESAYAAVGGLTADFELAGNIAADVTLVPGVYHVTGNMVVAAGVTVTLASGTDPEAVFIFKIDGYLETGAGSQIVLTGDSCTNNVYFRTGTYISLGAGSSLTGTLLSGTYISLGDGATVLGHLLAGGTGRPAGYISLDNANVTSSGCLC